MAKPNLYPLNDKIVVKRIEAKDKTTGGIVLPDAAKERPAEGVIVAVGRGRVTDEGRLVEPQVAVKDRILFSSYGGMEIKFEGDDYLIMTENDVLAVLK